MKWPPYGGFSVKETSIYVLIALSPLRNFMVRSKVLSRNWDVSILKTGSTPKTPPKSLFTRVFFLSLPRKILKGYHNGNPRIFEFCTGHYR